MNLIDLIKRKQSEYSPAHPKFFVFDEILCEVYKKSCEDQQTDPELLASKLIQQFQSYAIDIPNQKRYEYAIFSAMQHINLIINYQMEIETINYYLCVLDQIKKRQS
jgi:hypothetical protein